MSDYSTKRVAIIGAGCSGLTAIKTCLDEGLLPVCFEQEAEIGGLWNYTEDSQTGRGSVYESCVINTSKEMMAFSDFPVPAEFPPFMHHSDVLRYFHLYAEHFKLLAHIKFNIRVGQMDQDESYSETGKWVVSYRKTGDIQEVLQKEVFDGVLVCSGHHSYPYSPDIKGLDTFSGMKMHSHQYKTPNSMKDKTVLVIGIGNSAADIAVDCSRVTKKVHLSTRRGSWVVARMGPFGLPMDVLANTRAAFSVPLSWLQWLVEKMANFRFNHENFGLKPYHGALEAHPTINDDLPHRILTGSVKIRPDIRHFTQSGVVFTDGTSLAVDAVVMATGFSYKFKFLDESIVNVDNNAVNLYKYVYPTSLDHPSLGIIGLVQAIGAVMPISEMQCRWFTKVIKGEINLPPKEEMRADINNKRNVMSGQYVATRRHTLQTYWIPYMNEIADMIGVRPNLWRMCISDPVLAARCFFGPCLPAQYRLQGPGKWPGAEHTINETFTNIISGTRLRQDMNKHDAQNSLLVNMLWYILTLYTLVSLFCLFF